MWPGIMQVPLIVARYLTNLQNPQRALGEIPLQFASFNFKLITLRSALMCEMAKERGRERERAIDNSLGSCSQRVNLIAESLNTTWT